MTAATITDAETAAPVVFDAAARRDGGGTARAPAADRPDDATSAAFAWVGAVVINVAFGGLVAWGAATRWALGCALAAAYSAVLFAGAARLRRARGGEHTVLSSLLFLLGVVGIGVTGSFVPINLWGRACGDAPPGGPGRAFFVTNATSFPPDVAAWFRDTREPHHAAAGPTFAYLAGSAGSAPTVFLGSDGGDGATSLFAVSAAAGGAPARLDAAVAPHVPGGLASNSEHACVQTGSGASYGGDAPCAIGCTEGANFAAVAWEDGCLHMDYRFSAEDDRLYMIGWVGGYGEDSRVAASLDPRDMSDPDLVKYSVAVVAEDTDAAPDGLSGLGVDEDCTEASRRKTAAGVICLALLPALAASAALHFKRSVPSMPVGIYAATTGIVLSLVFVASVDPDLVWDANRWWLPLSAAAWIACLVLAFLTGRVGSSPLSWSLNFSGPVFFAGSLLLFRVLGDGYDAWHLWVAVTLTSFVPLLLVGVVTGRLLLQVLGAVGLMMDVYRLTDVITDAVAEEFRAPVTFSVLAVSGLGLGILGLFINKRADAIRTRVERWTAVYLSKWKLESAGSEVIADVDSRQIEPFGLEGGR